MSSKLRPAQVKIDNYSPVSDGLPKWLPGEGIMNRAAAKEYIVST